MKQETKPFETPTGFPQPFGQNMIVMIGNTSEIKTKSGLIIPANAGSDTGAIAFIMAVGQECKYAKPGMTIAVDRNFVGLNCIAHEGNMFQIMPDFAILCHLPENTAYMTQKDEEFTKSRRDTRFKETKMSIEKDTERSAVKNQKVEDKLKGKGKTKYSYKK